MPKARRAGETCLPGLRVTPWPRKQPGTPRCSPCSPVSSRTHPQLSGVRLLTLEPVAGEVPSLVVGKAGGSDGPARLAQRVEQRQRRASRSTDLGRTEQLLELLQRGAKNRAALPIGGRKPRGICAKARTRANASRGRSRFGPPPEITIMRPLQRLHRMVSQSAASPTVHTGL